MPQQYFRSPSGGEVLHGLSWLHRLAAKLVFEPSGFQLNRKRKPGRLTIAATPRSNSMGKKGPDPSALMNALAAELRRDFDGNTTGLFTISMATLTLLIDAGLIQRAQVVSRLQEFHASLWDEHRNGRPGFLLQQAIKIFEKEPSAPAAPN
jgi:hypothetical protein